MTITNDIIRLFEQFGEQTYLGESVSMAGHMLQCARLAELARENDTIILASLLHDIGHFLSDHSDASGCAQQDLFHQNLGAEYLRGFFPDQIVDPVRYHVDAKRYLCAIDKDYISQLTPASIHTLRLQGGPMNAGELIEFEQRPAFQNIIKTRIYDDQGKQAQFDTPDINYYRPLIDGLTF